MMQRKRVVGVAQAAALLGTGLLYQRTCHRQMTETMLREISRSVSSPATGTRGGGGGGRAAGGVVGGGGGAAGGAGAVTSDREGYTLAAGFALGLITLGTGSTAPGLQDLELDSRLMCVEAGLYRRHQLHTCSTGATHTLGLR